MHAKGDYVYYDDLCELFGQHIMDSLIKYNILLKALVPLPIASKAIVTTE